MDMFHNNLTNTLKDYLKEIGVKEENVNEYLTILTQPTKKSLIIIEQEEFFKIAANIKKDNYPQLFTIYLFGNYVDRVFKCSIFFYFFRYFIKTM